MEEDADLDETLRRHKDTLYGLADARDINVGEVFKEVVSGESIYARPEMTRLLDKVRGGCVKAVLCMDIDRLGRGDMEDQGVILKTFRDNETLIITPDHVYDLNDESDEQNAEFRAFFARFEYRQITKRLQRGKQKAIQEGCYLSNAPFGYINVVTNKKPTLTINEAEAKYVRLIFRWYCEGYGCSAIANMLMALGVRPHRSSRWNRNSVLKIIKNPVYIGKIVWNQKTHIRKGKRKNEKHITINNPPEKWTVVTGLHEPIISTELFEEAQETARSRYTPPSNDGTVKSPLAGLIRCGRCGYNMQRMASNNYGIPYLMCGTPSCCSSVQYHFVELAIVKLIEDKLREIQAGTPVLDSAPYAEICQTIKSEITKALNQVERLHDLLESGEYDIVTYRERMKKLSGRLDELREHENKALDEIARVKGFEDSAFEENRFNALEVYEALDAQGRNQILKSLLDHIDYYKTKKSKPAEFRLAVHYKPL
ncbi:MAG: recombinase family protein [Clostridiales bacterium]|nr:recombinase family protein [Clostridiales bacterium]